MTETSNYLESKERLGESLKSMGYIKSPLDTLSDAQFDTALNRALKDMREVAGVTEGGEYTAEIGQQILDKINETLRGDAKGGPFTSKMQHMRNYAATGENKFMLQKAGDFSDTLMKSTNGVRHMNGVLDFFKDAPRLMNDINRVTAYKPPEPEVIAPKVATPIPKVPVQPQPAPQSAQKNDADKGEINGETLKERIIDLQTRPDIGWTGEKNGVYSPEFQKHMTQIAGTISHPQSNVAFEFLIAMDEAQAEKRASLQSKQNTKTPENSSSTKNAAQEKTSDEQKNQPEVKDEKAEKTLDTKPSIEGDMDVGKASLIVEKSLITMAELEKEASKDGKTSIPAPKIADKEFGKDSNIALQETLRLLRAPSLGLKLDAELDKIPHWQYTPELGKALAPALKDSQNDIVKIVVKSLGGPGEIDRLILALDTLHTHGKLTQQATINPQNIPALTDLQRSILRDSVEGLSQDIPDALPLANEMMRHFTGGFSLKEFITEDNLPNGSEKLKGFPTDIERQLQDTFTEALKAADNDPARLGEHLKNAAHLMGVLPFGKDGRGGAFEESISNTMTLIEESHLALQKGETKEPENTEILSKIFAASFLNEMESINTEHGGTEFKNYSQNVTVDPRVEGLNLQDESLSFNVNDIIDAYNTKNPPEVTNNFQDSPLIFTDDAGKVYMAAIEKQSNIFTITEIPLAEMEKYVKDNIPPSTPEEMFGDSWESEIKAQWNDELEREFYKDNRKENMDFLQDLKDKFPAYKLASDNYIYTDLTLLLREAQAAVSFSATKEIVNEPIKQITTAPDLITSAHSTFAPPAYKHLSNPVERNDAKQVGENMKREIMSAPQIEKQPDGQVLAHYANTRIKTYMSADVTDELRQYLRDKPDNPAPEDYPHLNYISQYYAQFRGRFGGMVKNMAENSNLDPLPPEAETSENRGEKTEPKNLWSENSEQITSSSEDTNKALPNDPSLFNNNDHDTISMKIGM